VDSGFSLADAGSEGYGALVSTVTEIKRAVSKLPPRKRLALARWLQAEMGDRLSDEDMMAIATEGARALDKREAAYAKRKTDSSACRPGTGATCGR